MKTYEGELVASGLKFGIVSSRFNHMLVDRLVEGAVDCILRHGGSEDNIIHVKVPGSWEIPVAAGELARRDDIDAVIALGVLIRGQTPHFDYIAAEVSKGLANLSLELRKPITFGVITADTLEQAIERAGTKHGNKGWEAALSAIEMANLFKHLR